MSKTASGLVEWAKSWVGQVYWYGTFCNACTQSLYDSKKQQYPSHYTAARASKYKAHIAAGKRCADCVGLIKGYVWEDGGTVKYDGKTDVSADGMYNAASEKGQIGSIPEIPGVLVWNKGHIGVYIGGGEVIEARGFDYGVVKTKLKDRGWTNWCKCPYIAYDATPAPAPDARYVVRRLLKRTSPMQRGDDVLWLQRQLTFAGFPCGAIDSIFGDKTKAAVQAFQRAKGLAVDSIAGKNTVTALGGRWEG